MNQFSVDQGRAHSCRIQIFLQKHQKVIATEIVDFSTDYISKLLVWLAVDLPLWKICVCLKIVYIPNEIAI